MANVSECSSHHLDKMDVFSYVLNGCLSSATITFGITGSIISCIILRARKRTRFVRLLFTLCFWDVMLLVTTIGLYPLVTLFNGRRPSTGEAVYGYLIFYPLINWSMTGSKWMILVVTLERFWAFSRPFKQRFREYKSVKWLVLAVALWSLVVNGSTFFELTTTSCYSPVHNRTYPRLYLTKLRQNRFYNFYYRVLVLFTVDTFIPFVVVLSLTARVLLLVPPVPVERKQSTNSMARLFLARQKKRKRALMLAVVGKFLICYMGPVFVNTMEIVDTKLYNSFIGVCIIDISNFLVVFHSATNWLLFSYYKRTYPGSKKDSVTTTQDTPDTDKFFTDAEAEIMSYLWEDIEAVRLATDVLRSMIQTNPSLGYHVQRKRSRKDQIKREALSRANTVVNLPLIEADPKLPNDERLGMHFGGTLDRIVAILTTQSKGNLRKAKEMLRKVGQRHKMLNVNVRNSDWALAKEMLLKALLNGSKLPEHKAVANKFLAFVIHEIKCGFHCHSDQTPPTPVRSSTYSSITANSVVTL